MQDAAEEIVSDLQQGKRLDRVSRDRAFESFAEKMLENDEHESAKRDPLTARNERSILYREPDGVLAYSRQKGRWLSPDTEYSRLPKMG